MQHVHLASKHALPMPVVFMMSDVSLGANGCEIQHNVMGISWIFYEMS